MQYNVSDRHDSSNLIATRFHGYHDGYEPLCRQSNKEQLPSTLEHGAS